MSASRIVRPPRQAAILSAIVGLHAGAIMLGMAGINPRLHWLEPSPPPIVLVPPKPPAPLVVEPNQPEPIDFSLPGVTPPIVDLPEFEEQQAVHVETDVAREPTAGSGPGIPVQELRAPALRVQGRRLAALIDACYPGPSRRLGEEGRVVIRVAIDAAGQTSAWDIAEGSGFARLDAAVECVIRRLDFIPGRRNGEDVAASAMLPIVFQLD